MSIKRQALLNTLKGAFERALDTRKTVAAEAALNLKQHLITSK